MAHPRSSSIFAPNSSQLHRWKWEANQHRRRRSWNTSRLLVGPAAVVLDAAGVELIQSAERGILTSIAADLSHLETSNKDWKWKKKWAESIHYHKGLSKSFDYRSDRSNSIDSVRMWASWGQRFWTRPFCLLLLLLHDFATHVELFALSWMLADGW